MPGPAPKPADRRQRTNHPLALVAAAAPLAPKCPVGLLKSTREAWAEFWRSDVAKAVDAISDAPAVERLFTLRDERERCYQSARKGRLTEGSQGQVVINPLYKHMSVLDAEIRQLEDRLGLTPMARLKLGVQFGDARRSLAEMNASLAEEVDADEHDDPRRTTIETTAATA